MATVHREAGISFRVHSRDHPPAHVHACVGGCEAKVVLPTPDEPARVVRIVGPMKSVDVAEAVRIVEVKSDIMWKGWNRFHD